MPLVAPLEAPAAAGPPGIRCGQPQQGLAYAEAAGAGSAPADSVNPAAVEAMREVGIDMSARTPKILTTDTVQASGVVSTMGCGDTCPVFPGKRYLDWKLEDPAGQGLGAVRPIRDEIGTRVRALLKELMPALA